MTSYPEKITFGEMRDFDVRDVSVYCRDHRCSYSTTISRRPLAPNHVRLQELLASGCRCEAAL